MVERYTTQEFLDNDVEEKFNCTVHACTIGEALWDEDPAYEGYNYKITIWPSQ